MKNIQDYVKRIKQMVKSHLQGENFSFEISERELDITGVTTDYHKIRSIWNDIVDMDFVYINVDMEHIGHFYIGEPILIYNGLVHKEGKKYKLNFLADRDVYDVLIVRSVSYVSKMVTFEKRLESTQRNLELSLEQQLMLDYDNFMQGYELTTSLKNMLKYTLADSEFLPLYKERPMGGFGHYILSDRNFIAYMIENYRDYLESDLLDSLESEDLDTDISVDKNGMFHSNAHHLDQIVMQFNLLRGLAIKNEWRIDRLTYIVGDIVGGTSEGYVCNIFNNITDIDIVLRLTHNFISVNNNDMIYVRLI